MTQFQIVFDNHIGAAVSSITIRSECIVLTITKGFSVQYLLIKL